jgi:hypothetical protein
MSVSKADALPLTRLGGGKRGLEAQSVGARDAAAQVVADFDAAAAAAAAAADGGSGGGLSRGGSAAATGLVTLMVASPSCVSSR